MNDLICSLQFPVLSVLWSMSKAAVVILSEATRVGSSLQGTLGLTSALLPLPPQA